jgi:integrase
MDNSAAAMIAPSTVNCTVRQPRQPNAALRTREHLTTGEVEKLIECASGNRQGPRDGLMILLAFRHGLRAAEVCDLRWEQIDFATATLHVRRIKHGTPATHPLTGREMRALRKHQREGFAKRVCVCVRAWSAAIRPWLLADGRACWARRQARD